MKKLRRYLSIIAFVLVASLFISSEAFQIVSSAVGEDIRDSKLYKARSACEKEGYIFCPTDLNEGARLNEGFFAMDDINVAWIGYIYGL